MTLDSEGSQAPWLASCATQESHTACQSLGFPRHQRGLKTVLGLSRGLQVMCVGQISQPLGMTEGNFLRNASDSREHSPCRLDWEYLAGHALLTVRIS